MTIKGRKMRKGKRNGERGKGLERYLYMMTETMIWMERVRKRQGERSINRKQLRK